MVTKRVTFGVLEQILQIDARIVQAFGDAAGVARLRPSLSYYWLTTRRDFDIRKGQTSFHWIGTRKGRPKPLFPIVGVLM